MDSQQIITLGFVTVALAYLVLRAVRRARGQESDCDGCGGGCGKPTPATGKRPAPQATPLVTLGPPRRKSR